MTRDFVIHELRRSILRAAQHVHGTREQSMPMGKGRSEDRMDQEQENESLQPWTRMRCEFRLGSDKTKMTVMILDSDDEIIEEMRDER